MSPWCSLALRHSEKNIETHLLCMISPGSKVDIQFLDLYVKKNFTSGCLGGAGTECIRVRGAASSPPPPWALLPCSWPFPWLEMPPEKQGRCSLVSSPDPTYREWRNKGLVTFSWFCWVSILIWASQWVYNTSWLHTIMILLILFYL